MGDWYGGKKKEVCLGVYWAGEQISSGKPERENYYFLSNSANPYEVPSEMLDFENLLISLLGQLKNPEPAVYHLKFSQDVSKKLSDSRRKILEAIVEIRNGVERDGERK